MNKPTLNVDSKLSQVSPSCPDLCLGDRLEGDAFCL